MNFARPEVVEEALWELRVLTLVSRRFAVR